MMLYKLKNFNKKLLIKLLLAIILILVSSGCAFFGKKETKLTDNYCLKHYPLTENKEVEKDITKISKYFYEYVKINETTYTCECLFPEKKEQCYKQFLDLDNAKIQPKIRK